MRAIKKFFSKKTVAICVFVAVLAALLVGAILVGAPDRGTLSAELTDAVLHEEKKIDLFGWEVNPAVLSSFIVTAALLLFAACVRIFAIPRFKEIPGKFQLVIETVVGFFDDMAKGYSPERNRFLGCYIFAAGAYIFCGTLFELVGLQVGTAAGGTVTLSAPLSDINAAIALGCLSYLVILGGGVVNNGARGFVGAIKEFSLPISMSFRLFGALLSGLLVTELVYYTLALSVVLPVLVGVLFTLLHAVIQTYVLTMLTANYYGEVSERKHRQKGTARKERAGRKIKPSRHDGDRAYEGLAVRRRGIRAHAKAER